MIKKIAVIFLFILVMVAFLSSTDARQEEVLFWEFQSIDTMKYSRDIAREKLKDRSFDFVIDIQVKNIAQTGATHVAIATPYDEEFFPYLERWVEAARRYNLKVWFRGNWSGWEKWFGYESISRKTHIEKTNVFIRKHSNIFENGDIFSACPECENGGSGDPRITGDVKGYRDFLIEEYAVTKQAFKNIHKNVKSNFASMNGDVARLIMDKDTTAKLDGVVVIDHYVISPEKLAQDIKEIAKQSGGQVILGEFGAPILDIHGTMSEEQQAEWIKKAFAKLITVQELSGLNYWVNVGGSTELWNGKGTPRKGIKELTSAYNPIQIIGIVKNEIGSPINGAIVSTDSRKYMTRRDGYFFLPSLTYKTPVNVNIKEYKSKIITISQGKVTPVVVEKSQENLLFKAGKVLRRIIPQP